DLIVVGVCGGGGEQLVPARGAARTIRIASAHAPHAPGRLTVAAPCAGEDRRTASHARSRTFAAPTERIDETLEALGRRRTARAGSAAIGISGTSYARAGHAAAPLTEHTAVVAQADAGRHEAHLSLAT